MLECSRGSFFATAWSTLSFLMDFSESLDVLGSRPFGGLIFLATMLLHFESKQSTALLLAGLHL